LVGTTLHHAISSSQLFPSECTTYLGIGSNGIKVVEYSINYTHVVAKRFDVVVVLLRDRGQEMDE